MYLVYVLNCHFINADNNVSDKELSRCNLHESTAFLILDDYVRWKSKSSWFWKSEYLLWPEHLLVTCCISKFCAELKYVVAK